MRYDYVVTLKRENARRADLVSFLLLIFSLLSFLFVQLRSGFSYFLSIATLIMLAGLTINLWASRKGRSLYFRNWLLVAGIFWVGMPFFSWMLLVFIAFALLEAQAKYPLEIGFAADQIVLNTLFKKRIAWTALDAVILKDGILTLDFKNNRLLQKDVVDDGEADADEAEFNEYCRSKIVSLPS